MPSPRSRLVSLALLLALLARPSAARAASDHSQPACAYCRMILSGNQFGGSVQTTRGERLLYDSIECLAAAVLTDSLPPARIARAEVWRHDRPGVAVPLARATLVHCPAVESPMGLSLLAFASAPVARTACPPPRGFLRWPEVLAHVNQRWFQGRLDPASHAALPAAPRAR